MSELYDQVQDVDERLTELESNPVDLFNDPNTTDNIWDLLQNTKFIIGTVTLSSGTVTITDQRVSVGSYGLATQQGAVHTYSVSVAGGGGGTVTIPSTYTVTTSNGSFQIKSSDTADTSTVAYLIII